jgi:predicted O-methyltransferase YrrM
MGGGYLGRLANHLLQPFDLEVARKSRDQGEYTRCHPHPHDTLSPWATPEYRERHQAVLQSTLVSPDRLYVLESLVRQAIGGPGALAECGVYRGGTARLIAELARTRGRAVHLFDTFAGMPSSAGADPSGHRAGDFGDTSLDAVRRFVGAAGVEFHCGFIPDTFAGVADSERFSFVHIDVDLYASVRSCLEFFHRRMRPCGVILLDDYGFPMYRDAAKRATDEFFAGRAEVPLVLRTGQCIIYGGGRAET